MTELLQRLTQLAEEMDETAGKMVLNETTAFHGQELLGAAEMMRGWARGMKV